MTNIHVPHLFIIHKLFPDVWLVIVMRECATFEAFDGGGRSYVICLNNKEVDEKTWTRVWSTAKIDQKRDSNICPVQPQGVGTTELVTGPVSLKLSAVDQLIIEM